LIFYRLCHSAGLARSPLSFRALSPISFGFVPPHNRFFSLFVRVFPLFLLKLERGAELHVPTPYPFSHLPPLGLPPTPFDPFSRSRLLSSLLPFSPYPPPPPLLLAPLFLLPSSSFTCHHSPPPPLSFPPPPSDLRLPLLHYPFFLPPPSTSSSYPLVPSFYPISNSSTAPPPPPPSPPSLPLTISFLPFLPHPPITHSHHHPPLLSPHSFFPILFHPLPPLTLTRSFPPDLSLPFSSFRHLSLLFIPPLSTLNFYFFLFRALSPPAPTSSPSTLPLCTH